MMDRDKFVDPPISRIGKLFERIYDSPLTTNLLIIAAILFASLPILGIGMFATRPIAPRLAIAEAEDAPGTAYLASGAVSSFVCDDGKGIDAIFVDGAVRLSLSDGRQIQIPGSRQRFSNADDSFVFFAGSDEARITEHGRTTYSTCTRFP